MRFSIRRNVATTACTLLLMLCATVAFQPSSQLLTSYRRMRPVLRHLLSEKKVDLFRESIVLFSNSKSSLDSEENVDAPKEQNLYPAYVTLGALLLACVSNQWCRQSIYYLCDFSKEADKFRHINVDLAFSQEAYASLSSIVFTAFFAIFSIIAGSVADKYPRNLIILGSCAIWSLATALQSSTTDFWTFAVLRAIVGAGQAFFNPATYTIIADIFPKTLIAQANGLITSGIYLGGAFASLSIILDSNIGWRNTILVIGGIGALAFAAIATFVFEPRSAEVNINAKASEVMPLNVSSSSSVSLVGVWSKVFSSLTGVNKSPEARLIFAAAALRYAAGFSIGIWKAPFIFEKFPGDENLFAGTNALVVGIGGLASSLIGGYISDRIANPSSPETRPAPRALVPAVGSLLAAPAWYLFIKADSPEMSIVYLFAEYLFAECWFGPTLASLYAVVPKESRGTAQGIFSILTAAGNIGPILVGAFVGGTLGKFSIGDALVWAVCGPYVISSFLFAKVAFMEYNAELNRDS